MGKTLLIGEYASKKEVLIKLLLGNDVKIRRSLAMNYYDFLVDSPSEFLENKEFFKSLITASFQCKGILMIIHAEQKSSYYPPKFANLFNIPTIGVITYESKTLCEKARQRAELFLHNAGLKDIYSINLHTAEGIEELKNIL